MVKFHVGVVAAPDPLMKIQPESKPPANGWQGSVKDDCVTEWFPGVPLKLNVTTVPFFAVIVLGVNCKTGPEEVSVAPT